MNKETRDALYNATYKHNNAEADRSKHIFVYDVLAKVQNLTDAEVNTAIDKLNYKAEKRQE